MPRLAEIFARQVPYFALSLAAGSSLEFGMRPASFPLVLAGLVAAVSAPGAAAAAEPIAIVEQAHGVPRLEALDYLSAGQAIELGTDGALVVDYLRSCVRDSIAGGRVKAGKEQSTVAGGRVERTRIDCDHGGSNAKPGTEENSGGPGFVQPLKPEGQPHETGITHTIYSTSPLFDMGGPGRLKIEPLDPHGNAVELSISAGELVHGRFYDFAAAGKQLEAGGLYRASARGQAVVFWIDPLAHGGAGPPGGRLIRF